MYNYFLECECNLWYGCVYYKRTVCYCPVLHRKACARFFLSVKLLGTLGCKAGRVIPSCTRWYALSKLEGRKEGKEEGRRRKGGEEEEVGEESLKCTYQPVAANENNICTFSCDSVQQSLVAFCVRR